MNLRTAYPLTIKSPRREIERFVRFAIVGVTGTILDFGLLLFLKADVGLAVVAANAISYTAGTTNNFILNRLWTYPEARGKAGWLQAAQFALVSLAGLLINTGMVGLLNTPLEAALRQPLIGTIASKATATALVMAWNFLANRYWTFNDAPRAVACQQADLRE